MSDHEKPEGYAGVSNIERCIELAERYKYSEAWAEKAKVELAELSKKAALWDLRAAKWTVMAAQQAEALRTLNRLEAHQHGLYLAWFAPDRWRVDNWEVMNSPHAGEGPTIAAALDDFEAKIERLVHEVRDERKDSVLTDERTPRAVIAEAINRWQDDLKASEIGRSRPWFEYVEHESNYLIAALAEAGFSIIGPIPDGGFWHVTHYVDDGYTNGTGETIAEAVADLKQINAWQQAATE